MSALQIVQKLYKGTKIVSKGTTGIHSNQYLDCNCVDNDCSTETYD